MIDENFVLLRCHRNNIHRYRKLLATELSELERQYLERRISEEQTAIETLSMAIFPLELGAVNAPRRASPDAA
ncbi:MULTISPECIES: hypothetical protein [unclassified Bradyrhizobium]|uniref:hypothetical protein n=1 Tax=unclassified Bradyrhizobium TaxID=2631580 RepID=UPI0005651D6B|nr:MULTISPECIES: hypothetical protein [unclassified Bradyrhizobium]QIG94907.1 hypothetical protein G6P99_22525 [Bradyrhizobium sp. 6(2017)]